ncbi:hypothetical protein KM043_012633 [Ampulex compressa]|nr:hypothetical protein KM043_012633 [Ampulex compressa]
MCFVTRLPVIFIFGIVLLQGLLVSKIYGFDGAWCGPPVPQICWYPEEMRRCGIPDIICVPYKKGSNLNFLEKDDSYMALYENK